MARDLNAFLLNLLEDQEDIAARADFARAALLRQQEILLRQRAGAAAARLDQAKNDGMKGAELAALEARYQSRLARAEEASKEAGLADVRRPGIDEREAKIFGRVIGDFDNPPLTAAALSPGGEVLIRADVNEAGVFELSAEGGLEEISVQISDADGQILHAKGDPIWVEAGSIVFIEIDLGRPPRRTGPVPGKYRMPNLIGQSEDVARAQLEQIGLGARSRDREEEGPADIVVGQSPKAGTILDERARISLTVRRAPKRGKPRASNASSKGSAKAR